MRLVAVGDHLPNEIYPPGIIGQCTVLGRVGGKLMQAQRKGQRTLRRHRKCWAVDDEGILRTRVEWFESPGNYVGQPRLMPVFKGQQIMSLTKRSEPGQKGIPLIRGCPSQRLRGESLDGREGVLDTMIALADQQPLGFLGLHAFNAEPKLPGNGHSKTQLGFGKDMGRPVVGHEFADKLALSGERNEGQCPNAFCLHGRLELGIEVGGINVRNGDGLRILVSRVHGE